MPPSQRISVMSWVLSANRLREQLAKSYWPVELHGSLTTSTEESSTQPDKYTIKRKFFPFKHGVRSLWQVRRPDGTLYGYASTWHDAWNMVCKAVGWEPRP